MGRYWLILLTVVACGKVNTITDAGPRDAAIDTPDAPPDAFVPFKSCKNIVTLHPSSANGVYQIDPDGPAGPDMLFDVYCDMTMDGGGWTLAMTWPNVTSYWSTMTPGFTQSTSPTSTAAQTVALHYSTIADMGVTQMMIMGGDHVIKFYFPRSGVSFTNNYRYLTERQAFDPNHQIADAPHSGGARDINSLCQHDFDACTTSDYALFKTADPAGCGHDATNSYPAWGDCPGNGTMPPTPIPNCWFYGGTAAAAIPMIGACPAGSSAPWANYAVGTLTGTYTVWLR